MNTQLKEIMELLINKNYVFSSSIEYKDIEIIKNNFIYGFFELNEINNQYEIVCTDYSFYKILKVDLNNKIFIWDYSTDNKNKVIKNNYFKLHNINN